MRLQQLCFLRTGLPDLADRLGSWLGSHPKLFLTRSPAHSRRSK